MNKNLRQPVIAGNWKMNKTVDEAGSLIKDIIPLVKDSECEVVLCVPFVDVPAAVELTKNTNVKIGAQNCHFEESGAFTGEISAKMLSSLGVKYTIVGHSERRAYFKETDETINKRLKAVIKENISAILCVGENLEQRNQNVTEQVVKRQISLALQGVSEEDLNRVIIAYEPIWAIGTGKSALPQQAEEVCAYIRSAIRGLYGDVAADSVAILYGGSMNEKNAAELLQKENIDGGLIGKSSLDAKAFSHIVEAANQ